MRAAIMFAASLAVLSNAFPRPDERVKALAAYGATMAGSFSIGPLVGGALTSGLDWRWILPDQPATRSRVPVDRAPVRRRVATLFALWLYMTLYLQQILGLSAIEAGLVLVGGGQALLTIVMVDSSWWVFLPGLLVAMVGTGILNPIVSQVALSSAPAEQSGLAAGVNDMLHQAGIAVGVAALGARIPASAAVGDGSPQSYVEGMHDALWVGAGLASVAAVAAAVLVRGQTREDSGHARQGTRRDSDPSLRPAASAPLLRREAGPRAR